MSQSQTCCHCEANTSQKEQEKEHLLTIIKKYPGAERPAYGKLAFPCMNKELYIDYNIMRYNNFN